MTMIHKHTHTQEHELTTGRAGIEAHGSNQVIHSLVRSGVQPELWTKFAER